MLDEFLILLEKEVTYDSYKLGSVVKRYDGDDSVFEACSMVFLGFE